MAIFKSDDVVQFAIRIEENGEKFYRNAQHATTNETARALFTRLADEEVEHKETFRKMFEGLEYTAPQAEEAEDEYMANLRTFIDGRAVFEEGATAGGDTQAILDAAIQRELSAVLFYQELKKVVSEDDHKIIDDIIDEERRHFGQLASVKRSIK
jgi:rubrerythrin